jgi:arylsulfatase A-like enzyme
MPGPLFREDAERRPSGIQQEMLHSYLGAIEKFTAEDFRKMRLGYFASIALMDQEVGRVLAALEESGQADSTIVIFTSDHGDMLGDHNLLVKGAFFYDACTKVPLIMRWPQTPQGIRTPHLVQLHDLAATVLAAAGMTQDELKPVMPASQNLHPLIAGIDKALHDSAVCCYRNTGISDQGVYWDPPIHATMLRDTRYKLNCYHADSSCGRPHEGELYDLLHDPQECNNLWNDLDHQDIRLEMQAKLLDWLFQQELQVSGARSGEMIPDRSQQLVNALKQG